MNQNPARVLPFSKLHSITRTVTPGGHSVEKKMCSQEDGPYQSVCDKTNTRTRDKHLRRGQRQNGLCPKHPTV